MSIMEPPSNPNADRIVGIARDITEHKRDENKLRQSEEAYRTLAENHPDIIIRYDREYRRTYLNPACLKMFECEEDKLLGKTPAKYSPLIAPQYFIAELKKVIEGTAQRELEVATYRPNAEIGWYTVSLVPEFDSFRLTGVLCVARDITHAKQYELMLQKSADLEKTMSRMAANLPGFVFTLRRAPDTKTSFSYASPGIFTLFGLIVKNVSEDIRALCTLIHEDDHPRIKKAIEISLSKMTPCAVTFRVQIPRNEERWIETRAVPQRETNESDAMLWHGIMLDITERRQAEIRLVQKK